MMPSAKEDGEVILATQEELLESARTQLAYARLKPDYTIPECDNTAASLAAVQSYQQCDVDLGGKKITDLPEELIDIIKKDVTRLALNRNLLTDLSGLSSRIHQCTHLKYLVLKRNRIREFPQPILTITGLEYLDLTDNRIDALPEDLSKLANLKRLSISKNKIKRIPLCVVQMRTLHILDVYRNPIEFPPRKEWSIESNDEDDRNSGRSDVHENGQRLAHETQLMLKYIREEVFRKKIHRDGTDGEQRILAPQKGPADSVSESNAETPRPVRRKASGRPPIRPSVSAITAETLSSSRPASPLPPRPLAPKAYTALQTQAFGAAIRPGVSPLVNNNNERNRSNSESVMAPTTRRDKRKGFFNRDQQLSRELMLEQDPNSMQKRSNHLKGLSFSGVPNGDPSDETYLGEGEPLRPSFVQRLSSLPEGKRKSRIDSSLVDFARGISYSLQQVAKPLEIVLVGSSPKGPLGRTWINAYQFLEELHRQIAHAERQGEHDGDHARHESESMIHKSCCNCVQAFAQLCMSLQGHARSITGQADLKHVRTLMHMLYASLIEVQNACKRLGGRELKLTNAVPNGRAPYRKTSRVISPGDDRPVTSMRYRDQMGHKPMSSTSSYGFSQYNQFSMSSASTAGSTASFTPTTPYSIDSFTSQVRSTAPTTRSNSNANARANFRLDDPEEQQFEQIWSKLEMACDIALQDLPPCNQILTALRIAASERRSDDEASLYGTAYERGRAFIELAETLKARLRTVKIHERQSRDQLDFWQLCNDLTRNCVLFTDHIKDICRARIGSEGYDLKARIWPLVQSVRSAGRRIDKSPWRNLAVPSGQQPIIPLPTPQTSFSSSNVHARNTASRHHAYAHSDKTAVPPPLNLQTRGPVPPAPTSDPQSAASNASSGGNINSGHITPLPATPMSAALGHAALATVPGHPVPVHVPAMTDLSEAVNAAYNASINGSSQSTTPTALERSRSVSQKTSMMLYDKKG